jgi:hypothetical protein
MLKQYVNNHLQEVMYTILEKVSRMKNVDFSKIDNNKVCAVVSKTAYDILIAYRYLISSDDYLLANYLNDEIHNDQRWIVEKDQVRLHTVEGLNVVLTANNIESLDGLNATIKAITLDSEEFTVEETNTSTRINVKYKDYEINVRNKRFFITENTKEKMLRSPKASGLNSAITFLRTNKPNHQMIYKKEQQKTY